MGSQCTTPKTKGIIPSRKISKTTVSPVSAQKVVEQPLSFSDQSRLLQSKIPSWESLPNIESLETLSIRSKSMTTDVVYEDSPKLVTISSPTTLNSLPNTDNTDMKKSSPYKKGPSIGKGCYGEVHECLNLSSGELHAAKSVKAYGECRRLQNYIEAFKKEIVVLQGLSHANVVKYVAMETCACREENYTIIDIISEYVSGGSIKVLLDRFDKLDERVASHYTKQILEGLAYLHSNEIVHRNIKSSNILIDSCGTAKLADFGCFKSLEKFVNFNSPDKNGKNYSPKTRFCWQAPEVLMKKAQGKSSDIWSVGCVVLEMLTGTLPWKHANMGVDEVYRLIMSGGLPSFPENISENCRDFLSKVFTFRPEDRPTAVELLEHAFIRETIPSLSCLDYDSITQTLIHQTLMGHNSIDEIFAGAKRTQENNQGLTQDPSSGPLHTGPVPLRKINELTIHVGQSKMIPNHLNKPMPSLPGLVKLSSRTSIEDNSFCKNSWEAARTPGRRKEFDPEYGSNNSLSTVSKTMVSEETARFGSQTSFIHTPIRNTFFFSPKTHTQENHQSARRIENSSSFAIQASLNKAKNVGSIVLEKDTSDENASPMAQEKLRKMFEEKMQEELARIDLEDENKQQDGDKQNKSQEDLEQEKAELRRRYEQEMEQELNGLEVSHFDR